jgi:flavin-dependent dehydrogenase
MENSTYDCIVMGGGPAGSTISTILSQKGWKVLVVDKAKFPREHVGESLLPFCYQIFEEIGVLDEVKKRFSRKPGVKFSNIDGSRYSNWCFMHVIEDPSYLSFHVHRAEFDHLLLQHSEKNGATVRDGVKVLRVDFDSDPNHQLVDVEDENGKETQLKCRMVIDATGQDTLLARQLKCKVPFDSLHKRVAYSTHWEDIKLNDSLKEGNIEIVHLEGEKLGWIWMIPVWEHRISIGVALNMDYSIAQRKKLSKEHKNWQEVLYLQEIASSPEVSAVLEGARMAQPIAANGDFSYQATNKFSERHAIVGDAAGFLDPIFSSGIYLGMKSGQLVGNGIDHFLKTGDTSIMQKAYDDISGAYKLVEKLINTFYDPESISFTGIDESYKYSYDKFEAAYSILHLILAGDFFSNHEKYIKAIDMLRNPDMIAKYRHLIGHPPVDKSTGACKPREAGVKAFV